MLKPSIAAQSLSIKAHKNMCLPFLNASHSGFPNELKGGRYLHLSKMQLDCTAKPIQLLSKSAPTVNKSPGYMQQTDKEETALLKPCWSRLVHKPSVFHCESAFIRANQATIKYSKCYLETLRCFIPIYPTKAQVFLRHNEQIKVALP